VTSSEASTVSIADDPASQLAWRSAPPAKKSGGLLRKHSDTEGSGDLKTNGDTDEPQSLNATIETVSAASNVLPTPVVASFDERPWMQPLPSLAADAPVLIEAKGIHKGFRKNDREVNVLRGVNIAVRAGEFVVLTGPSGSGKSTLLQCLAGLDDVTRGSVVIDGMELGLLTDGERTRHRASAMGFVFQSYNLLAVLDAVENVELPLLLNGWSPAEAREEAVAALTLVGLSDRTTHSPGELSGGEQQRVTIARSLVGEPAIVWADEPTGNLDDDATEQVMHLLRELNADGLTVVMATHDPAIARLAHRQLELRDGVLTEVSRAIHSTLP
jgi:putative ABC transport system ATP-binding protein